VRRLGINGMVEVDEEKRKVVYEGDAEGLARVREKEERRRRAMERDRERDRGGGGGEREFAGVMRYSMVAKRIW